MELLELANVATQEEIARAAGYAGRTLRFHKQRLWDEGLTGLFDHPISGRPPVTTRPAVEGAVVQVILEAIIGQHALPDDATLAGAVNRLLAERQDPLAGQVTAPWLNGLIVQFSIAQDEPLHPLAEPEKRQRLFGDDQPP